VADLLRNTLRSLRAHKLRFTLTSLGIVWGAFMLTFLSTSLQGLDARFTQELESAGPRIVLAFPGSVVKERVGERGARDIQLEQEDVERVAGLESVEDASANVILFTQVVRSGRRTKLMTIQGVDAETQRIRNIQVTRGRFLSPLDVERGARVAFLGAEAAARLFDDTDPVGRSLQIEGGSYRVVGVAAQKGDELVGIGGADDRGVFVPYTTAQRWMQRSDVSGPIAFSPYTRETSKGSIRNVRELLGLHHDFDPDLDTALVFLNINDAMTVLRTLFTGLRIFMVSAGLMTLFVGAVGVMNIMLVVVRERTQEIGLRKSVGASSGAIFAEFVAEAAMVCVLSGGLGAALGVGAARLLASLAKPGSALGATPVLDAFTIAVFVGSLVLVGMIAGVAPAVRAARTDPSVALRAT
jgi:putative ABC transport system permease protein